MPLADLEARPAALELSFVTPPWTPNSWVSVVGPGTDVRVDFLTDRAPLRIPGDPGLYRVTRYSGLEVVAEHQAVFDGLRTTKLKL